MTAASPTDHEKKFIIAMDVGTTIIKCHLYDMNMRVVGIGMRDMELMISERGRCEMDPTMLWDRVQEVMKDALGNTPPTSVHCIGLSTLRNTFTLWNKKTGKHYIPFYVWKDVRSSEICSEWNDSWTFKLMRTGGTIMHFLTGKAKYVSASIFKLSTQMLVTKLIWALKYVPGLKEDIDKNEVQFGTIDTFLVYKMTGGNVHATDPSNACISGLYDPFTLGWANWALDMFSIPRSILPELKDTNAHFGNLKADVLGVEIPIAAVIGDQQSAMFGECCFKRGDIKATLGTGAFLNINTGSIPQSTFKGMYPLVGWKLKGEETTYLAEGNSADCATNIVWAKKAGLFEDVTKLAEDTTKIKSIGGLYFIPSFSGISAPYYDPKGVTAFLGLSPETTKDHLMKAVLDSIAFRVKQIFRIIEEEIRIPNINQLRVDGGVCNNDYIIQCIADLTNQTISRDRHREMSSRGAAFMAGLGIGLFKTTDDLVPFMRNEKVFHPEVNPALNKEFLHWEDAVERCLKWY